MGKFRGTAGFDLNGRGYYFAHQSAPQYYPAPAYPNFIDSNDLPPPSSNHNRYSPHPAHAIPPEFYHGKPAQSPSSSSSSSSGSQTISSNTIGVDSGGGGNGAKGNNKNENKDSLDSKDKIR